MRTMRMLSLAATAAALLASTAPAAEENAPPGEVRVVPPSDVSQAIVVRDVTMHDDGEVSGTVLNDSSHPVRDVRLLIDYAWLWNDERHPGADNPGRAVWTTVPGELRTGESRQFTYRPEPPLPERSDGRFAASVKVSEMTEIVPQGSTAGRR